MNAKTAATLPSALIATGEMHHERVRRWRLLPWPKRDSWWAALDMGEAGVGFVGERTEDACRERAIESVRFMHDFEPDGGDDCPPVVIWWQRPEPVA